MVIPILKSYYEEIFFEFLIHNDKKDCIILLSGFPSSNQRDEIMHFFYEKGFNVFFPRFKGTFQSEGKFLETNPVSDLLSFIKELKKGYAKNLWDMNKINFKVGKIYVIGDSFSGAIACGLGACSKDVSKIILASPVLDYKKHNIDGNEQDLDALTLFVKRAYKNLYRYSFSSLQKQLDKFKEISPSFYLKSLNKPILLLHDPNDNTVSIKHSKTLFKNMRNCKIIEANIGHGFRRVLSKYPNLILDFLNN
jgi:esterase/lipase